MKKEGEITYAFTDYVEIPCSKGCGNMVNRPRGIVRATCFPCKTKRIAARYKAHPRKYT